MAQIDEDWDWELTLEKISEEIHSEEEKNLKEFSAHVAFCWVGAEDGYVEAQYLLGLIYYTGRRLTVDCDYEEACYWFKKAADKKHGKATYYLARIYEERLYRSDASLFLCKDLKPIEDLYIKAHDLGVEETEGCFVYPHMLQKFIYNLTEKYTIAQKDAVFERLVESFVNDEDIGKGLNAEEKNAQLVSLQGYLYGLRDYKAYLAKAYEEE